MRRRSFIRHALGFAAMAMLPASRVAGLLTDGRDVVPADWDPLLTYLHSIPPSERTFSMWVAWTTDEFGISRVETHNCRVEWNESRGTVTLISDPQ